MKNRLMSALLALFAVCSIGFVSCKKETVVQQNSSAYNYFVLVNKSQWQYDNQAGAYYRTVDLNNVPNGFIFSMDGVLMYVSTYTQSGTTVTPDPLNAMNGNGTLFNGYSYYFITHEDNKGPYINIYAAPTTANAAAPSDNLYFSIVLIQAQDLGQLSNTNTNNYSELKQSLHLTPVQNN